jgi:histidinol-phosphate aminotransferase
MTTNDDRRLFLRGSVAVASTAALSSLIPIQSALAKEVSRAGLTPAYGPLPGVAKLNSNENPYGPSPLAIEAMIEASRRGAYYVDDSISMLVDMIAERNSLNKHQISLSSGSSGVLTYAAFAAAGKGKILGPDLFWDTTARAPQRGGAAKLKRAAKTDDLSIDLDALYAAIDDDVAMVQVTNPNNPTGLALDTDKLKEFCKKASKKTIVLVDEAYIEFTDDPEGNSMVSLINEGYNIMVARTFSKIYGMAGMRVGYMLGSEELISFVKQYSLGNYALNQAGVAGAVASYDDEKFLAYSKSKVTEAREMVTAALKQNGLTALPSMTNFIYVNLGSINAEIFRQKMADQDVLIRGIYQDYDNWSRVSMGYIEDVQTYITALPIALEGSTSV